METADEQGQGTRMYPKSIRHKQILNIAEDRPDASIEEIADDVPSATADLVENVLDEYGDPEVNGNGDSSTVANGDSSAPQSTELEDQQPEDPGSNSEDSEKRIDLSLVNDRQRKVLELIHERPEATQREIGEQLAVTAATVSNRVNAIPGFEWTDREEIVNELFGDPPDGTAETTTMPTNDQTSTSDGDDLSDRVSQIEQQLNGAPTDNSVDGSIDDPELLHKVFRACFESDSISEVEEREVLKTLMR